MVLFFFSSRRRHTRWTGDWSSDVCSSDLFRKNSPVFRFTRTAYLLTGEPVEFVKSAYRGDRCKVVNRLTRQPRLDAEKEQIGRASWGKSVDLGGRSIIKKTRMR